jgi:hypothetical protein
MRWTHRVPERFILSRMRLQTGLTCPTGVPDLAVSVAAWNDSASRSATAFTRKLGFLNLLAAPIIK